MSLTHGLGCLLIDGDLFLLHLYKTRTAKQRQKDLEFDYLHKNLTFIAVSFGCELVCFFFFFLVDFIKRFTRITLLRIFSKL